MDKYDPKKIEPKWQKFWAKNKELYTAKDDSKQEKSFILDMFPYPSGTGLHVGHVESYTATDIYSRYLRMNGKNVLHPQGFDAFGLPAENYAIKTGVHPKITTEKAVETFKRQINEMSFSYDWSREVNSSLPDYYKWTQWLFLLFYKNGLAYKKKAKVNWCPKCQTVLANEQVIDGKCERCESEVVQKDLEQWFFRITDFIEDNKIRTNTDRTQTNAEKKSEITSGLLSGLNKIDWPESTKMLQRNWVGRSEGATVKFEIKISNSTEFLISKSQFPNKSKISNDKNKKQYLEIFTTRVDTIFGCTYCVVAPEHPMILNLKSKILNFQEVEKYIQATKKKTDLERMEAKIKTGVELKGIKIINPFNNEELPLYVADYVLSQYGTGAVMAVPAHDERDFEFAKKYNLSIKEVIQKSKIKNQDDNLKLKILENAFTENGVLVNSNIYNGLTSEKAREKLTAWLEKNKLGQKKINYKLRDWLVSRQRYWGAPIPVIYCSKCQKVKSQKSNVKNKENLFNVTIIDGIEHMIIPVPEKDLPVVLPDDVDFKPTGESPLKYSKKFQNVKCPKCGAKAKRESDTMDTFVCSSWYYLRYADPKNETEFASKELLKKWLPVDLYVGGAEHSVLHLLYARFFTKVLHNLGYLEFDEPFLKLRHQGTILAEDGTKMSKSKGNVVNPDDEIKKWGADSLRLFEMFMGPLEDMKPWQTQGIVGVYRFLEKVYKLKSKVKSQKSKLQVKNQKLENLLHKTIKKVTEDIENLRFNTAISALMILTNKMDRQPELPITNYQLLITLLSPFAPHIAEELWHKIQTNTDLTRTDTEKNPHKSVSDQYKSVFLEAWPKYDPRIIKDEEINLVIQINGKVRDRIKVSAETSKEEAKNIALESEKVKNYITNKEIRKVIFVKGKLINIVI